MEAPSLYEDLYNELQQVMERFTATERALAQRESELSVVGTSLETLHAQYKEVLLKDCAENAFDGFHYRNVTNWSTRCWLAKNKPLL